MSKYKDVDAVLHHNNKNQLGPQAGNKPSLALTLCVCVSVCVYVSIRVRELVRRMLVFVCLTVSLYVRMRVQLCAIWHHETCMLIKPVINA